MWAELGHNHFLYMPAVSNVVTNGTKNVLKGTMRLGLCLVRIQSSVYGAITVAILSQFSTWIQSTVSFYSMEVYKSTRLDVNKCR